jgi:lysophospholipase L1-like esterase
VFTIGQKHQTKWDSDSGRAQPISLVPISRGSLDGKKIFTIGSCFALEIRAQLADLGYQTFPRYYYIRFDQNRGMIGKLPHMDNINHYSVASILQEFENIAGPKPIISKENFFDLDKQDSVYRQIRLFVRSIRQSIKGQQKANFQAKWQDPFRKQVYAEDLETLEGLSGSITQKIREGAHDADLFIVTLGMTEIWLDKKSKLAICNSYGAKVDEALCDFKDLSLSETQEKLAQLVRTIRQINPKADIVFTVSPVPLQRTAKNESVVTANAHSKAKQRAAVAEVCTQFENVFYFPSFELSQDADFFEADGRHVTRSKVNYIVESFLRWYQGR